MNGSFDVQPTTILRSYRHDCGGQVRGRENGEGLVRKVVEDGHREVVGGGVWLGLRL